MTAKPRLYIDPSDVSGALRDTYSAQGAITATPGGTQATSLLVQATYNRVTVVATAGDAVKLPAAVAGAEITIFNKAAANSLNVFPGTGDAINALAANAAYALAATKGVTFVCCTTGFWDTILTA
jgi:hypothetical protein